jgi:hypothetical protein
MDHAAGAKLARVAGHSQTGELVLLKLREDRLRAVCVRELM